MENLERVLREHAFLKEISGDAAALLVSCAKNVRFRPGEFLLREGQPADTFFLIRIGRVVLESNVPGRGPTQLEDLEAGAVLGLSWLVAPYRYHVDARAAEPVVALAFDAACLRGKMEGDHDLGFALTRRLFAEAVARLERVRLQRLDVYGTR
jgi:CRP/FNR family transcriptional regulator, cyclic AMP receptor protein